MKILLGMSGGLDSTYAARLLAEGNTVEGAALLMHEETDIAAAQRAAKEMGIPLHTVDCREAFLREVIEYFVSEYKNGRTPNPCTVCNPRVKIGELCRFAALKGFDAVATGHYARIVRENGRYAIRRGADERKDQSYMLWGLSQEQLSMLLFPLGELEKEDIRMRARELGLSSAEAKESQDVCFIPDGKYAEFVESRAGKSPPGNFVDADGRILGTHKGIIHYTVGQRRGLGVSLGGRMFVSEIRPDTNEILLLPDGGEWVTEMTVSRLNYQLLPPPAEGETAEEELFVKVRYAARPLPARAFIRDGVARVRLSEPVRAITPGQSAVFYRDGRIAFGGIIEKAIGKQYFGKARDGK